MKRMMPWSDDDDDSSSPDSDASDKDENPKKNKKIVSGGGSGSTKSRGNNLINLPFLKQPCIIISLHKPSFCCIFFYMQLNL